MFKACKSANHKSENANVSLSQWLAIFGKTFDWC